MFSQPTTCKHCAAAIIWASTATGRTLPCNPHPVTVIDRAGLAHTGLISHLETCPHANRYHAATHTRKTSP